MEIINGEEKKHDFIYTGSISLENGDYDFGRPNFVKIEGCRRLLNICKEKDIEWNYIGILDADSRIGDRFFEKIIAEFQKDDELGVASGTYYENGERDVRDFPRGSLIFRKECYSEIGGYSNHFNSVYEAEKNGWEAKTLPPFAPKCLCVKTVIFFLKLEKKSLSSFEPGGLIPWIGPMERKG
ncbi:hypothetical protein AKJ50_02070 [candidate division MSBL1 archaeon SCGC-AAA382A13]|uniref:Glycosyltransferase 2-like domain-containing protein n=1 Tax=candidate division MSBL1 archaeon SCGC-AAA382A13 TaxID=1698279 RepID=A0A133VE43_9EURY|nr:hypothetical protein AKJ50_02070 [candidate division MSBL1 archaeon SCGC-AAA382A13]